MPDISLYEEHDLLNDPEVPGIMLNWIRAISDKPPATTPVPNDTVRCLVAQQAGFRNAWALGLAPPPSIETQSLIGQQTPALSGSQSSMPVFSQSIAFTVVQNSTTHTAYRLSSTPPGGGGIDNRRIATATFGSKEKGAKRSLLLAENELDDTNRASRNTSIDALDTGSITRADSIGSSVSIVNPVATLEKAPAPRVNIQILGNLMITVEEYLTFFPLHTLWSQGLNRLVQNGWDHQSIARFINWARDLTPAKGIGRTATTIETQIVRTDMRMYKGKRFGRGAQRPGGRVDDLSTTQWSLPGRSKMLDCPLKPIISGVIHFPNGEGRRELTMAMEYAAEHPDELSSTEPGQRLMLSDVPLLIHKHGFSQQVAQVRIGSERHDHPDFRALENHRDAINRHYQLAKQKIPSSRVPAKMKGKRSLDERDLQHE